MESLPIKPIKKKSVSQEILEQIKALIDSGHLVPGSKLPSERELSKMLAVSRPSLREALKALSLIGAIENRQGDGTYLSASSSQRLSEPFSIYFSINRGTLFDISEARKILEVGVAALAAKRRTDEDLMDMEVAIKKMRANIKDLKKYGRNDIAFHSALTDSIGNIVISDLMGKLYKLLFIDTEYHQSRYGPDAVSYREQVCRDHEEIHRQIKAKNENGAVQAMMDHLINFGQRFKEEQFPEIFNKNKSPKGEE